MADDLAVRVWGEQSIYGPRHELREKLMLELLSKNLDFSFVSLSLEAGCGSATFSKKLLQKHAHLKTYGFDSGQGYAKSYKNFFGVDACNFCTCDFAELDEKISSQKYQLIICAEVLEHLDDDNSALSNLVNLMDAGGTILISVPHRMDYWSFEDEWAQHKRRYELNQLEDLIISQGLEIIESKIWGYPVTLFYDKFIFRKMLKKDPKKISKTNLFTQLGSKMLYYLMHLDRYFLGAKNGLGIILIARKPTV